MIKHHQLKSYKNLHCEALTSPKNNSSLNVKDSKVTQNANPESKYYLYVWNSVLYSILLNFGNYKPVNK